MLLRVLKWAGRKAEVRCAFHHRQEYEKPTTCKLWAIPAALKAVPLYRRRNCVGSQSLLVQENGKEGLAFSKAIIDSTGSIVVVVSSVSYLDRPARGLAGQIMQLRQSLQFPLPSRLSCAAAACAPRPQRKQASSCNIRDRASKASIYVSDCERAGLRPPYAQNHNGLFRCLSHRNTGQQLRQLRATGTAVRSCAKRFANLVDACQTFGSDGIDNGIHARSKTRT